jgi:hypothetical protein
MARRSREWVLPPLVFCHVNLVDYISNICEGELRCKRLKSRPHPRPCLSVLGWKFATRLTSCPFDPIAAFPTTYVYGIVGLHTPCFRNLAVFNRYIAWIGVHRRIGWGTRDCGCYNLIFFCKRGPKDQVPEIRKSFLAAITGPIPEPCTDKDKPLIYSYPVRWRWHGKMGYWPQSASQQVLVWYWRANEVPCIAYIAVGEGDCQNRIGLRIWTEEWLILLVCLVCGCFVPHFSFQQ